MSNKSDPINFDAVCTIICWHPGVLQRDVEREIARLESA